MAILGTYPLANLFSGTNIRPGNISPIFSFQLSSGETISRTLSESNDPYSFLVVTGHYFIKNTGSNISIFDSPTINGNSLNEIDNRRDIQSSPLNYRVGMWYYPMPTSGAIELEAVNEGGYQLYRVDGVKDPTNYNLDITESQTKSISSAIPAGVISVLAPSNGWQNASSITSATNKIPAFNFLSSYNPNIPISPISFTVSGDTVNMWSTTSWVYDIPPV
jgi:hypothetical protein